MKHIFTSIVILISSISYAQNGLENIIVEKYYKSSAQDTVANADGGVLPVGSVTYRIYADLLPGYRFQAAYGLAGHELRIETSTLFFNNTDRGDVTPSYTKAQARLHTVMLDSWLSVGAACDGNFGILKTEDFDSLATVQNNYNPQILQNSDTSCGIAISIRDGMVLGNPKEMTNVGISSQIVMFGDVNDGTNGPVFSTFDGSWACLGGSVGPDSTTNNRVLIAQITTNGQLKFELNIQIGTPEGNTQNYVAKNPVGNEIQLESLTYIGEIDSTSSIKEQINNHSNQVEVFPNPTNNQLFYKMKENTQIQFVNYSILNLEGRVIKRGKSTLGNNFSEPINCEELSKGFYFLELQTDKSFFQKKFIKN
jgi:hypothetical protein